MSGEHTKSVESRTEETKRTWYDRLVNILASILLILIWRAAAWLCAKYLPGSHSTEDQFFMWIVAASLAINLPATRGKKS